MARPKKAAPTEAPAEAPADLAPETAPVASNIVTTLPLFSLCLSGLNVRQTERDADIAALAEDIAARGLKQNLVVIPAHFSTAEVSPVAEPGTGDAENQPNPNYGDRFEVVAGGRRYQALKLLAEAGRLPHDHPVPVMVEARTEARETSLSENLHRVAMNPADEFDAFAQIAEQQQHARSSPADAISYVAKRFGVTQRHVEGRLRLAALAPEILEALRSGALTLDSAKAYAGTEDHELQRKVFKAQEKSSWNKHDPRGVRQALRGATLPLGDGRVKFVGIDAYRAAGGRCETEMFMGTDGEERVTDLALLDRLCADRAEPLLAAQAKADGYASGMFAPGCGYTCKKPKPPEGFELRHDYSTPPAKELKKRIAIYTVAADGDGLTRADSFKPAKTDQPAAQAGYTPMTDEERAQQLHDAWVEVWAARLAVGSFAGTPLEGKAFWPRVTWPAHMIELEYADDVAGFVGGSQDAEPVSALIEISVRVTAEQMALCRTAAESKVTELEAEQAARDAAAQAARDAAPGATAADSGDEPDIDEPEPGDEDLQTENDDEFGED